MASPIGQGFAPPPQPPRPWTALPLSEMAPRKIRGRASTILAGGTSLLDQPSISRKILMGQNP